MRHYELTYIVASDVDEEGFRNVLAQVRQWVEELSGQVTETYQWGRRKLAYQIGEYTEGTLRDSAVGAGAAHHQRVGAQFAPVCADHPPFIGARR
jgi:small subunit ribosomal protein S6